ncbi:MAG: glycosyltransferase [Pseudomonadota bacterium]
MSARKTASKDRPERLPQKTAITPMKILFVHDNYPAQFGALGGWLARRGWEVRFATSWAGGDEKDPRFLRYKTHREPTEGVHPYAANFEKAVINGQSAARAFITARDAGFSPDVIMAHSGWGSGMFARNIWPTASFVPYFEWWYRTPPPDDVSLGTYKPDLHAHLRQTTRNTPFLLDYTGAALRLCPTEFQASQFPEELRQGLTVLHDGLDLEFHAPATAPVEMAAGVDVGAMNEIVTFFTRGMEPHRGFPQFMRALAAVQARRPDLHAIIGGEDRVAYGSKLPEGESWKARMLAELDGQLDLERVHWVGLQPRGEFVKVLQASHAHVYLTADFVLSWSMLDAMAIGCPMVASDCAPVREFMDDETGLLVGLDDEEALANAIDAALSDRDGMRARGLAARERVRARCDRETIYPEKEALLKGLL